MNKDKKMTPKEIVQGIFGLVIIVSFGWFYFSGDNSQDTKERKVSSQRPIAELNTPLLAEPNIKITVDSMKMDYPSEIKDAAITQEGNQVSLVLIVTASMNQKRAKELGDNFLRQILANSIIEKGPTKIIGPTKLSYLIGIYGSSQRQIAIGSKAPAAHNISW